MYGTWDRRWPEYYFKHFFAAKGTTDPSDLVIRTRNPECVMILWILPSKKIHVKIFVDLHTPGSHFQVSTRRVTDGVSDWQDKAMQWLGPIKIELLLNFLNIAIYVKTVTSFWSPASSVYRAAASPPLGNGYFSTLIVFLISQRLCLMISRRRRDADTSFHIFLRDEVLWRMSHQLSFRLMQIAHETCLSVILHTIIMCLAFHVKISYSCWIIWKTDRPMKNGSDRRFWQFILIQLATFLKIAKANASKKYVGFV